MIRYWIIQSYRRLIRYKGYLTVNVLGLTLGFTAFMLIGAFIFHELNWDKAYANYDRICRVQRSYAQVSHAVGGNDISPHTCPYTATLLEHDYPEIEKVTLIRQIEGIYLSSKKIDKLYDEEGIYADSSYMKVFCGSWMESNALDALDEPYSIILSRTLANKLFAGENAIGQTVMLEKKQPLLVKGIYDNLPNNTTIRPSYIVSFATLRIAEGITRNALSPGNFMLFTLLKPDVNRQALEGKITNLYASVKDREMDRLLLCPLSLLHLNWNGEKAFIIMIGLYGLIAVFILVMSAFNYMNLSMAQSAKRSKEVAVNKMHGATQPQLIGRFLGETVALSCIAVIIAFALFPLTSQLYRYYIDSNADLSAQFTYPFFIMVLGIALVIGLGAGIYPALNLSSHPIVLLFKQGMFRPGHQHFNFRKVLIVFQFAISIFLICLSLFLSLQIKYMINKDMGFHKADLLVAKIQSSRTDGNFEDLRGRLLQNPHIINACMSRNVPFLNYSGGMINWEGAGENEKITYRPNEATFDFVNTMGLKVVDGRDFSREHLSDVQRSCLINEAALKCFGWQNPIGKRINNNQWTIVGVVKNYHIHDTYNAIEPVVIYLTSGEMKGEWVFSFKVNHNHLAEVRQLLTREFETYFPNDPFEFQQLDNVFEQNEVFILYNVVNHSILFFTGLNVFMAIIGLLGLVSYSSERRTKEIGVRKINGCTSFGIFLLMSKEYWSLLGISLIIAWPAAYWGYFVMPGYHKPALQWWVLPFSVVLVLLVILITTGYQTYRAATRNPIEILRSE